MREEKDLEKGSVGFLKEKATCVFAGAETFPRWVRAGGCSTELFLPKAFPAAAGTSSAWEGFREMYILINECAFTFAFLLIVPCSGGLFVFPPAARRGTKRRWGVFVSIFEMSSCLKERAL